MNCTCGAWWLPGGSIKPGCPKHSGEVAGLPQHNLDESRKRFPALAEDYRRLIRINGNLAADSKE